MTTRKLSTIPVLLAGVLLAGLCGPDSTASESQRDSSAVIGKPFRVSSAVNEYCAMTPKTTMCEVFEPQLAEFLAESRDTVWAAPVERLIAKSMLVKGQPWAEVRALECRHTLCALEYAVSPDDMGPNVDGSEELERLMEGIGGVMAPELKTGSAKPKWVSVLIWRKRS